MNKHKDRQAAKPRIVRLVGMSAVLKPQARERINEMLPSLKWALFEQR